MVLLLLTPALEARLVSLQAQLPAELAQLLASALAPPPPPLEGKEDGALQQRTVSHELLVKISQWARKQEDVSCTLASLLSLTDIHAPPLPPRHRSAELESILSAISLSQDRASYARMTSLHGPSFVSTLPLTDYAAPSESKSIAEEWREVRKQLSAVVNVLASMATVVTSVWWVGGGRSVQARLGLSMFGAFAIAAIEAFLYWRFFTRESEGKEPAGGKKVMPKRRGTEGTVLKFEVPNFAIEGKQTE